MTPQPVPYQQLNSLAPTGGAPRRFRQFTARYLPQLIPLAVAWEHQPAFALSAIVCVGRRQSCASIATAISGWYLGSTSVATAGRHDVFPNSARIDKRKRASCDETARTRAPHRTCKHSETFCDGCTGYSARLDEIGFSGMQVIPRPPSPLLFLLFSICTLPVSFPSLRGCVGIASTT